MLASCIKLLEPIMDKIFKLEGNGILINEVYMAFKNIKSTLSFILPDITILNDQHKEQIMDALNRHTNNCIKPIHCVAYLLGPKIARY